MLLLRKYVCFFGGSKPPALRQIFCRCFGGSKPPALRQIFCRCFGGSKPPALRIIFVDISVGASHRPTGDFCGYFGGSKPPALRIIFVDISMGARRRPTGNFCGYFGGSKPPALRIIFVDISAEQAALQSHFKFLPNILLATFGVNTRIPCRRTPPGVARCQRALACPLPYVCSRSCIRIVNRFK